MNKIQKPGWIRFMDEMPPTGMVIIIAYSSGPYNGKSWARAGKVINLGLPELRADTGLGLKNNLPIYNSENFDTMKAYTESYGYAHHWAYYIKENQNIDIRQICEYDRRNKKISDHPVKCNLKSNGTKGS
jgi:hypothetical protein